MRAMVARLVVLPIPVALKGEVGGEAGVVAILCEEARIATPSQTLPARTCGQNMVERKNAKRFRLRSLRALTRAVV